MAPTIFLTNLIPSVVSTATFWASPRWFCCYWIQALLKWSPVFFPSWTILTLWRAPLIVSVIFTEFAFPIHKIGITFSSVKMICGMGYHTDGCNLTRLPCRLVGCKNIRSGWSQISFVSRYCNAAALGTGPRGLAIISITPVIKISPLTIPPFSKSSIFGTPIIFTVIGAVVPYATDEVIITF